MYEIDLLEEINKRGSTIYNITLHTNSYNYDVILR